MMKRKILFCCLAWIMLLVTSCAQYKDIPYLQNSAEFDGSKGAMLYDMTIKPKDQLMIFVSSPTDEESVAQFNIREPRPIEEIEDIIRARGYTRFHYYLVDNEGNIDFPVIGKVHLEGLTIDQANDYLKGQIAPYLQSGYEFYVNTYIRNFEVTVMGEVTNPSSFTLSRPKVTVLEALAMAGDMTIYGKRDNVKLLRELADGTYEVHELDMRDANILNSPYYYLQQRDIVYVEPNEVMAQNAKLGETRRLWLRGASITISLGSLLYRVLK